MQLGSWTLRSSGDVAAASALLRAEGAWDLPCGARLLITTQQDAAVFRAVRGKGLLNWEALPLGEEQEVGLARGAGRGRLGC